MEKYRVKNRICWSMIFLFQPFPFAATDYLLIRKDNCNVPHLYQLENEHLILSDYNGHWIFFTSKWHYGFGFSNKKGGAGDVKHQIKIQEH